MEPITSLSQLDFGQSYTYADYLNWQFSDYVELVAGQVLTPMPGRSPRHQQCLTSLMMLVRPFLKKRPEAMMQIPFDVCPAYQPGQTDAEIITVVQPDLIVVRNPAKIAERGCFGAPDWVVEILSAGFTHRDTRLKFDLYEANGVGEYWLVAPGERTVLTYLLRNGRYQLAAEYAAPGPMPVATLPGLAVEWAEVFDES